jgi:hypothetical protein
MPPEARPALAASLEAARARGCRVAERVAEGGALTLVADGREALVGTLAPPDECQAVRSANPAFVGALRQSVAPGARQGLHARLENGPRTGDAQRLDWLAWEERKQRHLLGDGPEERGVRSA